MSARTPLTYYGGKQLLAKQIVAMMPTHRAYLEPFAGGAAGAFVFIALAFAALWRVHEVWKLVTAAAHRTGEHGP